MTFSKKISLATIILITFLVSPKSLTPDLESPKQIAPEISVVAPKKASSVPPVPSILEHIADCESGGGKSGSAKQFNPDGSVVRGKINPKDIGKFQINEYWNGEEAKRLGFDLYTLEGNTKMALYMYRTQGVTPWAWSRPCWGSYVTE